MRLQFKCQQCGRCCTKYSNGLTAKTQDIARWRREKRGDILKHVKIFESEGVIMGGEIWINPKTGRKMRVCPFLVKGKGRFSCSIHTTKPLVCSKYPFTGVGVDLRECKGIKILQQREG
jgi:Fe-S-cluster containining protein